MADKAALMIIDVQEGFFNNMEGLYKPDELIKTLQGLIGKARAVDMPIIFVRHDEDPENDGDIHPDIYPQEGDLVVSKMVSDSFKDTILEGELKKRGIKKLIIGGLQTEYCVDTTTRRAFSMDYDVTLVADAHSTFDFDDSPITAAQIIAHHTSVLRGFATVVPAAEIEFA